MAFKTSKGKEALFTGQGCHHQSGSRLRAGRRDRDGV